MFDLPKGSKRLFQISAAVQIGCGVLVLYDCVSEIGTVTLSHIVVEAVAILMLWGGAAITLTTLHRLIRRNIDMEEQLRIASGAFQSVLEERFRLWSLSPSERDVAILTIKGASISEIAAMRNTKLGTVKAQNASIYRKAGVSGRSELLSIFLDELAMGLAPHSSESRRLGV